MSLQQLAIRLREQLLDVLAGAGRPELNHSSAPATAIAGTDLAADLRATMQQFMAQGMGNNGASVDYAAIAQSAAYQRFRNESTPRLQYFDPGRLHTLSARLAFWLNLYNVLTLDAVIALGVRRSVTEGPLGMLFFRRAAYRIAGQRVSLEDIEHGILRGNRGHPFLPGPHFRADDPRMAWVITKVDPRLHFALNCASRSCPPIRAYDAELVTAQLDQATRSFVHGNVRTAPEQGRVWLSPIFKWFRADFGDNEAVLDFVIQHLPRMDARRRWLETRRQQVRIVYDSYDWSLNV